ncbi:MAG: prephenate dehydratase [Chitinophagales bacterium]
MINKVAIQGFEASFHEAAAHKFFGDHISTVHCLTFDKLFDVMQKKQADLAVMAIENSVAGAILPNYARLRASNLEIVGEVFIRIEMNLMALVGQSIDDIIEVHSHPIALLQCAKFFREHPSIRIVESNDTALSAKEIADQTIKGRAALASKNAAKLFGLEIIAPGIETNKRNFTRFLVLKNVNDAFETLPQSNVSKASWSFRTAHTPGSLAKILTILGDHNINLTKIQSLPVLGSEWTYYFYADLEFDQEAQYQKAKTILNSHTVDLKILGEYAQGEKYL